ncbi:ELMO/CED-12 family-domain-containing protein [Dipodascopsis uninucleata]
MEYQQDHNVDNVTENVTEDVVESLVRDLRGGELSRSGDGAASFTATQKSALKVLLGLIDQQNVATWIVKYEGFHSVRKLLIQCVNSTPTSTSVMAYCVILTGRLLDKGYGWDDLRRPVFGEAVSDTIGYTLADELFEALVLVIESEPNVHHTTTLRVSMLLMVQMIVHYAEVKEDESEDDEAEIEENAPAPASGIGDTAVSITGGEECGAFQLQSGFMHMFALFAKHPNLLSSIAFRMRDTGLAAASLQLVNVALSDILSQSTQMVAKDDRWPAIESSLYRSMIVQTAATLHSDQSLSTDVSIGLTSLEILVREMHCRWRARTIDVDDLDSHIEAFTYLFELGKQEAAGLLSSEIDDDTDEATAAIFRHLGFLNPTAPEKDFENVGWIGVVDLIHFVRELSQSGFSALLHEQWAHTLISRQCPIVGVSIAITSYLCEFFNLKQHPSSVPSPRLLISGELKIPSDPLFLQWSTLHFQCTLAFIRLWHESHSERKEATDLKDFNRILDLIRALLNHIREIAARNRSVILRIADTITGISLQDLRRLQISQIEKAQTADVSFDPNEVMRLRSELAHESLEFIIEQRINCLIAGAWFCNSPDAGARATYAPRQSTTASNSGRDTYDTASASTYSGDSSSLNIIGKDMWKYVRLSHNRQQLHYGDYDRKLSSKHVPSLDELPGVIDICSISHLVASSNLELIETSLADIVAYISNTHEQHSANVLDDGGRLLGSVSSVMDNQKAKALSLASASSLANLMSPSFGVGGDNVSILGASATSTASSSGAASVSGTVRSKYRYKLTLHGFRNDVTPLASQDATLLQLYPETLNTACEWYDGLNILLGKNGFAAVTTALAKHATAVAASSAGRASTPNSRSSSNDPNSRPRSNGLPHSPTTSALLEALLNEKFISTAETIRYTATLTSMISSVRLLDLDSLLVNSKPKPKPPSRASSVLSLGWVDDKPLPPVPMPVPLSRSSSSIYLRRRLSSRPVGLSLDEQRAVLSENFYFIDAV